MMETVAKTATGKNILSPVYESTELLTGEAVLQLLNNVKFQEQWDNLYDNCPWATVFQSRSFVAPWYQLYGKESLPILVKTEYAGKLTGLLTLAIDKKWGITGAAAGLAEYQAWLTANTNDGAFIKKALVEIRKRFPRHPIMIKYLPANTPLQWAKNDRAWSRYCFVKPYSDPLMLINEQHFTAELKKKNRREKMNRLKRLGEVKFERITSYPAFASIIDELILQSDFRKGSRYNKLTFKNEPARKQFLLNLFEQNILHVTVLKIDNKIIASNVSIGEKDQLYLQGINAHAPAFSKHSPGIIHFLLLGKLLAAEEEVKIFTLTPGEDAYKGILATDYTTVYTLQVGNKYCRLTNQLKNSFNRYFKNAASRVGINAHQLKKIKRDIEVYKEKITAIRKQGYTSLLTYFLGRLNWRKKKKQCRKIPVSPSSAAAGLLPIQKDNLEDLLNFKRLETIYTMQEFLAGAMQRFEEGQHCYSWAENGVLLACVWTTKSSLAEYGYNSAAGEQPVVLSAPYCHPDERSRIPSFLRSVAAKIITDEPNASVYVVTVKSFES